MNVLIGILTAFCIAIPSVAQVGDLSDWKNLVKDQKNQATARALCTRFQHSTVVAEQVEAEKCLANVALMGGDTVQIQKDKDGTAEIYDEYIPAAIDESLEHLNQGLKLAPQDLSIHQGRLHVLEIARRYDEMAKALDESCTVYRGKNVPDAWLDYAFELYEKQQYKAGLALMRVLEKYYPENGDVIGNVGAFLSILRMDTEAIPYLRRAADMAPKDPINAWDLGREYDFTEQISFADAWYQKAISLETDPDRLKQDSCLYAVFVEKKLNDPTRACEMEKKSCGEDQQTACKAKTPNAPKP